MTPSTTQNNPLRQYFRSIKIYIKLPSGTTYYDPSIITFNELGEVGVMPMTGKDELALKNPDGLLNGESLVEVLQSCVPALKQPKALLTNDIDALITAIRQATYNDSLETELECPKCNHTSIFKLDLQYALDNMEFLDPEYIINLDTGLTVFIRPYAYPEFIKTLHSDFERSKATRQLENDETEDSVKSAVLKKAFLEIASTKFELMTATIIKIVDEANNIDVTDKKHILEFVQNIDKKSADKITDLIGKINAIGVKRTFMAICEKCNHSWQSEIDFNPVNFS